MGDANGDAARVHLLHPSSSSPQVTTDQRKPLRLPDPPLPKAPLVLGPRLDACHGNKHVDGLDRSARMPNGRIHPKCNSCVQYLAVPKRIVLFVASFAHCFAACLVSIVRETLNNGQEPLDVTLQRGSLRKMALSSIPEEIEESEDFM